MVNLLNIGMLQGKPKEMESSGRTPAAVPAPSPVPSTSVRPADAPAPSARPMGLGAFLKAAQSGAPIQAPVAKEIHPPSPPAFQSKVPVVEARGPEGIKATLKKLDDMIGEVMRVEQTDFDIVRGYVSEIMVELKTMPEYRGFVRAKDVHNLMLFIQSSSSQAGNQFKVSAEKKAKAVPRKTKAANFNLDAFGDVPQKKMNLEMLAGINTDDIPEKNR